jgi:hypothetical protein
MTTLEQLESELKIHVRQRPGYSCEKCRSNFSGILDLSEHERVDHNSGNKQ